MSRNIEELGLALEAYIKETEDLESKMIQNPRMNTPDNQKYLAERKEIVTVLGLDKTISEHYKGRSLSWLQTMMGSGGRIYASVQAAMDDTHLMVGEAPIGSILWFVNRNYGDIGLSVSKEMMVALNSAGHPMLDTFETVSWRGRFQGWSRRIGGKDFMPPPTCQHCLSDPRYTGTGMISEQRCPVCGAPYSGPRRSLEYITLLEAGLVSNEE